MDPLAHSVFGVALARTRIGRDTALAVPVAIMAANVSDFDVFAHVGGIDLALWFRRGWTHGPLGIAVLPVLVVVAALLCQRWRNRGEPVARPYDLRRLALIAYVAALSHPLLDWLNTYGVRLFMPFDRRWFYGDALFIIDPWVWLLLGGAAFLCHQRRRAATGSWIALAGATTTLLMVATDGPGRALWFIGLASLVTARRRWWRRMPAGPKVAEALVVTFLVYAAGMTVAARAAAAVVRSELAEIGVGPVERLLVGPVPLTPLRREVVVATADTIRAGEFHWFPRPHLELSAWVGSPARHEVLGSKALADPCLRGFANWARFPYVEHKAGGATPAGERVHLVDARYPRGAGRGFGSVTVIVSDTR